MRIKLFENFLNENQGPEVLDSFQEAEGKLSGKEGIVLSGVNGDITDIESVIDKIPHTACFILITDKSGHVPSAWKSDVFLVDAKKDGDMSIKQYFEEDWIDPAGGTHHGDEEDPAAMYEGSGKYPELDEIVGEIAEATSVMINDKIKDIQSKMPYKAQYVLEEVIKNLQARV